MKYLLPPPPDTLTIAQYLFYLECAVSMILNWYESVPQRAVNLIQYLRCYMRKHQIAALTQFKKTKQSFITTSNT
jgi:hypothetical protein